MFTCSSVTLWKTVEKTKIRLNFYFRVVKWGVSSRGIPLLTPLGSRGAPCFRPLIFQLENRNSPLISFSQLFSRTVTDKQVNKGLFLLALSGVSDWQAINNFNTDILEYKHVSDLSMPLKTQTDYRTVADWVLMIWLKNGHFPFLPHCIS